MSRTNTVAVPVAANNAAAIAAQIANRTDANGQVTMGSRTPTRLAENAAVNYLNTVQAQNPKFILMATDGQPNCAASGSNTADDTPGSVAAVTAAHGGRLPDLRRRHLGPCRCSERRAQHDGGRGRLPARGQPASTTR